MKEIYELLVKRFRENSQKRPITMAVSLTIVILGFVIVLINILAN